MGYRIGLTLEVNSILLLKPKASISMRVGHLSG